MLAQTILAGFWLALGGLSFMARLSAVTAVTGAGALSTAIGLSTVPQGMFGTASGTYFVYYPAAETFLSFWQTASTIVLVVHAILLPLRALLGWRINFDPTYHELERRRPMQMSLSNLIAYVAACALPFALWRFAHDESGRFAYDELLFVAAILALFAFLGAVPIVLLVIARRWPVRMRLVATVSFGALMAVDYFLVAKQFDVGPDEMLPFSLGVATTTLGNLEPIRELSRFSM
jgi:hypothetical protein